MRVPGQLAEVRPLVEAALRDDVVVSLLRRWMAPVDGSPREAVDFPMGVQVCSRRAGSA